MVAPYLCIMQASMKSADDSARLWQGQKKEKTPYTEMSIFLSKLFFRQKLIKVQIPPPTSRSGR